jgi:hypothetical protein
MVKGARRIDALLERVRMEEIHTVVFHCLEMRQREPTAWERGEVEYGAAFDGPLRDLRKRPEIASMLPAIPQGVLLEGARCARHVLKPKVMERLSAEGVRQVIALCCAMNECVESGKEHGGTHRQEDAGIAIAVVESLSDLQNILKAMAA